jgi:hypothetical protein
LLALPALLAAGLLRYTRELYQLPQGFYGIESIFLLLGLMALARIRSLEQLRYQAPGEWGKLLGLDRIPEVRTLRAKLKLLCQDLGRAMRWNAELAKEWIAQQNAAELYFYGDGHVRVYHRGQTALPRHYVARERLCLRATTDYWINALDGQPFLYGNKEVDPGLIATLKQDVIPWLEANVAKTPEQERHLAEDPHDPLIQVSQVAVRRRAPREARDRLDDQPKIAFSCPQASSARFFSLILRIKPVNPCAHH